MSRCDTCKNSDLLWYKEPCNSCCGTYSGYEPKEETMPRYIDADKLIDDMAEYAIECIKTVDAQPTADVRENVRGEWVEVLRDTYGGGHFPYSKCSVCQSEQIMDSNFCPNCGADMRGDNK